MPIKDTLKTVMDASREAVAGHRDTLIEDAEARLSRIADTLAARIRSALLTSAIIIAAALLILAGVQLFRS